MKRSRVYAPRRLSIARYVSRALSRFASGASAVSSLMIASRSDTQYQVAAIVKKIATTAVARLLAVRRDRVEQLRAGRELVEMLLEPGEDVRSDACRIGGWSADGVPDLVQRRRHREPDEQRDRAADDEEVQEDRDRLGDAVPAEPVDAGPDRGRERERQEQEDQDRPHLPDAERERHDRERGGGRLRHADREVAVVHLRTEPARVASSCSAARFARR